MSEDKTYQPTFKEIGIEGVIFQYKLTEKCTEIVLKKSVENSV